METVIPPDKTGGHVIQKYHFKVLLPGEETKGCMGESSKEERERYGEEEEFLARMGEGETPTEHGESVESPENPESRHDEVMEQMLRKADELSTNLVKMQMQLEKQQEEFEKRLEEERERAYREGAEEGRARCMQEMEERIDELRSRVATTVEGLEASQKRFLEKVDTIEEELIETALDLAKQVIAKEIREDSKEVALRLAKLLLMDVKDAAKITLKVNPEDYDHVKGHLESDRVEVVADPAVGAGGVVVLSDIGNIDGEIMHRFERIKEAVFGTVK
ncbi:flagellar assembly protein FliH [Hydrogenimonas sp.]